MKGTMANIKPTNDANESSEHDFVIESRPQITVFPNKDGDVAITVTRIVEETDRVEREMVVIPAECVADIAAALQRIASAK
jgi:hypothetical protein